MEIISSLANPTGLLIMGKILYVFVYLFNKCYVYKEKTDGTGTYETTNLYNYNTPANINNPVITQDSDSYVNPINYKNAIYTHTGGIIHKYTNIGGVLTKDPNYELSVGNTESIAIYNDFIYVADTTIKRIRKYSIDKTTINGNFIDVTKGLTDYPSRIVVYENILYIAMDTRHPNYTAKVGSYNATTGTPINASLITGIKRILGMAADSKYLYIIEHYTEQRLLVYDKVSGGFIYNLFDKKSTPTFDDPNNILLYRNYIFVCNKTDSGKVFKILNPFYSPAQFPKPWGAYIAGHSMNTASKLHDFTGNGNHADIIGTSLSLLYDSGYGANAKIPYLRGTETSKINWPFGSCAPTFTYSSISKTYGVYNNARVFDATDNIPTGTSSSTLNLGHGYAHGIAGMNYYRKFSTSTEVRQTIEVTNWLVMCGTNDIAVSFPDHAIANGIANGCPPGLTGWVSGPGNNDGSNDYQLTINNGIDSLKSNFDFQQIFIWNQGLTAEQMYEISESQLFYLKYGIQYYPWTGVRDTPCFLEGSKILQFNPDTQIEQYVPIETLRKGDLIKTSASGYKAISHIGKKPLPDPATNQDIRDRLYVFSSKWAIKTDNASEASEDLGPLCLTGRHCLLHANLSESELETVKQFTGDIYITENKYRVPAYLDARGEPYTKTDPVIIWHFALENENIYFNYGVYANGILVESSSIEYMTDSSNMELL